MIPYTSTNRGLIKMILIIIVVLLVLAYFGLNIRSIVASPTFQDNWAYIQSAALFVWNNFLKVPFTYLWNLIIVPAGQQVFK